MIAHQALRSALLDQLNYLVDDCRTVRSPVDQIAKEYQPSAIGRVPGLVVSERIEQLQQHLNLAMHISDNV